MHRERELLQGALLENEWKLLGRKAEGWLTRQGAQKWGAEKGVRNIDRQCECSRDAGRQS